MVGLLVAGVALLPPTTSAAALPVLVLDGTGFGHGVGLSQWGAEYMARTGRTTEEILATFYRGVQLGEATGTMRVAVHTAGSGTTTITFPSGGEVRSAPEGPQAEGFPVRVGPGGRVRLARADGGVEVQSLVRAQARATAVAFRQEPCALVVLCPPDSPPGTTAPAPPTTSPAPGPGSTTPPAPPPDGGTGPSTPPAADRPGATVRSPTPVVAVPAGGGLIAVDDRARSYRGALQADGTGGLRLVNIVDVEDYLRGMAEVPGSWPAAAVRAQTIAARTYGLRAVASGGEICDDARCQVYEGATAESPGQDAAVAATARRVLVHDGRLVAAVYSADAGGVSATTLEGFGTPDGVYPYLRAVSYETDNPLPWRLEAGVDAVAARLGYPGRLTGVRVGEQGPSGRALRVVLLGSAGERSVDGLTFARRLGLRSTRFTVRLGDGDGAAPLPPAEEPIQALPDDAARLAAQPAPPRSELAPLALAEPAPAAGGPTDARSRAALALVAGLLAATVAGALVPAALAGGRGGARASTRWRALTRSR